MTDISLQFHCLPDELIPVLSSFLGEVKPYAVAIRFHPFSALPMDAPDLPTALGNPEVRRIIFTASSPVLGASAMGAFLDQNPGALLLDIGRHDDTGLKESWLTARTEDPAILANWRKLMKRLRGITRTGTIAVNPITGATSELKNHRFSERARTLANQGVEMLPAAGTARLKFVE